MWPELEITTVLERHWDAFYSRLKSLLDWPPCASHCHQSKIPNVGSNRLKVDFVGRFSDGNAFTIEYQTGKANLDHAKAFAYPVLCEAKCGVWMAGDFPPYIVRLTRKLNEMNIGISFHLVKMVGRDENACLQLVV